MIGLQFNGRKAVAPGGRFTMHPYPAQVSARVTMVPHEEIRWAPCAFVERELRIHLGFTHSRDDDAKVTGNLPVPIPLKLSGVSIWFSTVKDAYLRLLPPPIAIQSPVIHQRNRQRRSPASIRRHDDKCGLLNELFDNFPSHVANA